MSRLGILISRIQSAVTRLPYSGSLEPLDRNDLGKHGYIQEI